MVEATRSTSGFFPALPSSFPELEKMTVLQLQRLLNDEVTLEVTPGIIHRMYGWYTTLHYACTNNLYALLRVNTTGPSR